MIHLLDSNIIIYAASPDYAGLADFLEQKKLAVSMISYIEVLGYHKLTTQAKDDLESFFAATKVVQVTDEIAQKAVELRQIKRSSLGDSIIAATALVENLILVTRNTKDFGWVPGLSLIDPIKE